jgi:hypothetical protein
MTDEATREALSEFWRRQIEAWQVSGQSQQAFCRARDLIYHRFVYWRRKFQERSVDVPDSPSSALVPVTYRPATGEDTLSVVLPNGLELRGITANNLALTCRVLERLL